MFLSSGVGSPSDLNKPKILSKSMYINIYEKKESGKPLSKVSSLWLIYPLINFLVSAKNDTALSKRESVYDLLSSN